MKMLRPAPFAFAAALLLHSPVLGAGILDHLICYDVKDKLKPPAVLDLKAELQPEFSQAGCQIKKVTKFCVPATKTVLPPAVPGPNIVGQPLQNDYICYQIKCPQGVDIADKLVIDQFGSRPQEKFHPIELCAPARKGAPPCFRIGTSKKCGGVCPNDPLGGTIGTQCRFDDDLQDCTCAPEPCGGKPDKTGHCGGECVDPAQTCRPGLDAAGKPACLCDNPPVPCSLNHATGTCGGDCQDPAAKCVIITLPGGVVDCVCQPPVPECDLGTAGQCAGPCPAPFTCQFEPAINDCRCEPPPQPCGPNPTTGQCGGECPATTVCRFVTTAGANGACGCVNP